jgi:hypothetical protein
MGRTSAGFGVTFLVLAVVVASASGATRPTLRVAGTEPLVLRGDSFRPYERIVVTALTAIGPQRLVVRASARGRFGVTFRLPNQRCGKAFAVRAVGAVSRPAALSVPAWPCVPPPLR